LLNSKYATWTWMLPWLDLLVRDEWWRYWDPQSILIIIRMGIWFGFYWGVNGSWITVNYAQLLHGHCTAATAFFPHPSKRLFWDSRKFKNAYRALQRPATAEIESFGSNEKIGRSQLFLKAIQCSTTQWDRRVNETPQWKDLRFVTIASTMFIRLLCYFLSENTECTQW